MVNFFSSPAEKARAKAFAALDGIVADWLKGGRPAPFSEALIEALRSELRAAYDKGVLSDTAANEAMYKKYDNLALEELEERLSLSGRKQELLALRRDERLQCYGQVYDRFK
jgi:hypothetical protein